MIREYLRAKSDRGELPLPRDTSDSVGLADLVRSVLFDYQIEVESARKVAR